MLGQLRAARAAVVARAIEALVVRGGERRQRRERRAVPEDAFRVVGVEADALPLRHRERPALVEDGDRNANEFVRS